MRKNSLSLIFLFILIVSGKVCAQGWRDMKTVEDVCMAYPDCTLLLDYYQNSTHAQHLREKTPALSEKTEAEADSILNNIFVIQNVGGVVPWGEDGHRDWHYRGPNNDREWAWLSNRHSQLSHVFDVYLETGNPKYAIYVDEFLRDFIIKSMPYPGVKGSDAVWRGLEVSFRSKVWSRIFYGLLQCEYLQPSTRLLMLSSIPHHAHYNRYFHSNNNWLTMEISALATVVTNFPEYKDAEEWLNYSIDTMAESMKNQVYPDGVQTELTSHYHNVSLSNFDLFKEICDRAGKPLPPFFNRTLEAMYAYIAHAVRPDGNRILNNDGDLGSDRSLILKGAQTYDKPGWKYIVTNGKSGIKPTDGPSYL